jgi:hypothetical protein
LSNVKTLKAVTFKTTCFMSSANGKYKATDLPLQAQLTPVYAISVLDYDKDGKKDIVLGGNVSHARLKFGYCRAGHGALLKGNGNGGFDYVPQPLAGLHINGDIRSIISLGNKLLFGINNGTIESYQF